MCGIIGVLGNIPKKEKFINARDVLEHRGPDDSGFYYNMSGDVALGHRRLSIIDLSSAGRQPFFSNDKRYIINFNGEIYNYLEIKKELKDFYDFKTETDTEVLLASYIKWGIGCLNRFNGMFAFVIWDRKEKKLFCARDRLGIKPFFYNINNKTLNFASEIKALLELGVTGKPNECIIFDYLNYGFYDHTDDTFFDGVKKLPAGHYAIWKDGKIKIKEYWDLAKTKNNIINLNNDEIKNKFKELLADSIRLRFRSDVPVGIYLSSGLDSNTLLYYSKRITGMDVDTFSMCFQSKEYNECTLVNKTLNSNQKKHWNTCSIDYGNILELAKEMNKIQDQPYGGIPTLGFGELNRKAKEKKVTVLLHGQGVDEILAGYKYYSENNIASCSQDSTIQINSEIVNSEYFKKFKIKVISKKLFDDELLNKQYCDIKYYKIPRALRFTDHASMAYGRELRVPYLDHRLVEFCFWLPKKYKINKNFQKVLIRDAMKFVLPDIIKDKRKKSFGAVQVEILRKYYKKQVLSLLNSNSFKSRGYWDYKELIKRVNKFYDGEYDNSFFIWQCINLELWFREYIDNK